MIRNTVRGAVTDTLLSALAGTGKPVGDAEGPHAGGWQGDPNSDGTNFVPFVVCTPQASGPPDGPIGNSQADVVLPYALTSFGVSRKQCEWMADEARKWAFTLNKALIDQDGTYHRKVIWVAIQSIGAVTRQAEQEPAYYGQTDIIALWTSDQT